MSDFDAALERLLADPSFAAALAADPGRALAGYRLSADEVQLLHTQVGGESGGQRDVEVRANQSSLFGMLSPIAGIVGGLGIGDQIAGAGASAPQAARGPGPAGPPIEGFGPGRQPADGRIPDSRMGEGIGGALRAVDGLRPDLGGRGGGGAVSTGFGPADPPHPPGRPVEGFGAVGGPTEGFGRAPVPAEGFGARPDGDQPGGLAGLGDETVRGGEPAGVGDPIGQAQPAAGPGAGDTDGALSTALSPPEGYHTRVDVDGDGDWDRHMLLGRVDGGVDILVDADGDGRVDFVGHDTDADGRVDSADYDTDRDGFFDKRMYDDNGDGWLDRTVRHQPPAPSR